MLRQGELGNKFGEQNNVMYALRESTTKQSRDN